MLWAVVSAVAAFLTPGTCFYCSYCFSVFSDCLCFQNKLMMMMMMMMIVHATMRRKSTETYS